MPLTKYEIQNRITESLGSLDDASLPIDVEKIARAQGINIIYEDLENDVSGFLVAKNGCATIAINKLHNENRKRFTLDHELGHFILHLNKDKNEELFIDKVKFHRNQASALGLVSQEIEANRFAAEVLMPEEQLISCVENISGKSFDIADENLIAELAQIFAVSEQALTIRLGDLFLA